MGYILTKLDLAAFRHADGLSVSLKGGKSRVALTKRNKPTPAAPFAQDIDHLIEAPVTHSKNRDDTSAHCWAHMDFYCGQDTHISAVASTLRVGDDIAFQFCPDYHTNQNMEKAGLHGDVLRLIVTRKKRRLYFEIDHMTCPDNTARMCRS